MKHFVRVSIILGTFIIVMSIIKFQENNLKNKTKGNKDVQEKRQQEILDMTISILADYGYKNIQTAKSVKETMKCVEEKQPDLAILDVMLPDGNGFELLEKLRKTSNYPILFLTARGEDEDKFKGFGLGADDYIVKPFLPKELLFRITAILRRTYKKESPIVNLNGCQIDFSRGEIVKDNKKIVLSVFLLIFAGCLLIINIPLAPFKRGKCDKQAYTKNIVDSLLFQHNLR